MTERTEILEPLSIVKTISGVEDIQMTGTHPKDLPKTVTLTPFATTQLARIF